MVIEIISPCLSVPEILGEKAIQLASKLKIIDKGLMITKKNSLVIIPLVRELSKEEITIIKEQIEGMKTTTWDFREKSRNPKTLLEALSGKLPPHLLTNLPHSMDIIGRVAIIEVPSELLKFEDLLGGAVMKVHKRIETVLAKLGAVSGELRLRNYKVISGVKETETVYREHSCIYHLDPTKVYFSPRLSQERWRISQQVKEREIVIDMFAGVGPFSIQIGKKHKDAKVYAMDINPDAYKYLKKNVVVNKVENRIIPILGDARAIIRSNYIGVADRVIMNLPERAIEFIDIACKALKLVGGVLHYYGFETEPDALGKAREKLNGAISRTSRNVEEFTSQRRVRPTAPHEWQVALDVFVR